MQSKKLMEIKMKLACDLCEQSKVESAGGDPCNQCSHFGLFCKHGEKMTKQRVRKFNSLFLSLSPFSVPSSFLTLEPLVKKQKPQTEDSSRKKKQAKNEKKIKKYGGAAELLTPQK